MPGPNPERINLRGAVTGERAPAGSGEALRGTLAEYSTGLVDRTELAEQLMGLL